MRTEGLKGEGAGGRAGGQHKLNEMNVVITLGDASTGGLKLSQGCLDRGALTVRGSSSRRDP